MQPTRLFALAAGAALVLAPLASAGSMTAEDIDNL